MPRGAYLSRRNPDTPNPSQARAIAKTLVADAPGFMRDEFRDEAFLREFTASIKADAISAGLCECGEKRGGDRTARQIVFDSLHQLGLKGDFHRAMAEALGVAVGVAKLAVAAHENAAPLMQDKPSMVASAEAWLLDAYRENPALAARSPLRAVLDRAVPQEDAPK